MAVLISFDEGCLLDPMLFAIPEGGQAPFVGGPEYANAHMQNRQTGIYKTAILRYDQLQRGTFDLNLLTRDANGNDQFAYLLDFIDGGYGSGVGFRCRYPHFHSVTLEVIAGPGGIQVPNGALTTFKLYRSSTRKGVTARSNVKRIAKPVVQAAKATGATLYEPDGVTARKFVGDAGAPGYAAEVFQVFFGAAEQTTGWTVNVTTGIITFSVAPPTNTVIKWSGSFDLPMAFTDNQFNLRGDIVGQAESVGMREISTIELGIAY